MVEYSRRSTCLSWTLKTGENGVFIFYPTGRSTEEKPVGLPQFAR
jgi:hypothetical protein